MGIYYAQIHLLEDCNLQCKHCYQQGDPRKSVLSLQDFEQILNDIDIIVHQKESNTGEKLDVQINLTGGEPLLHRDLFECINMIVAHHWRWALLTNGTLLTDSIADRLSSLNPVFVQVSLEGNKAVNDSIRGNGTFEQILSGIDILKHAGIKVLVSFTINSENWKEFPGLAKICRQHKVDKLWCDRYVGNDTLTISTEDFKLFLKLLKKEMHRPSLFNHTKVKAERSLQFLTQDNGHCSIYQCSAGGNLIVICANGDVLPCRRLPLLLGNIHDNSLPDIIENSDIFKELSIHRIPDRCVGCMHKQICRGGARCITYAQTGSLCRKDVNCIL